MNCRQGSEARSSQQNSRNNSHFMVLRILRNPDTYASLQDFFHTNQVFGPLIVFAACASVFAMTLMLMLNAKVEKVLYTFGGGGVAWGEGVLWKRDI